MRRPRERLIVTTESKEKKTNTRTNKGKISRK